MHVVKSIMAIITCFGNCKSEAPDRCFGDSRLWNMEVNDEKGYSEWGQLHV